MNERKKLPPGYIRVHRALRRERGPARNDACVDCDKPAAHWSLTNPDPEKWRDFSEDLSRYSPRCVGCHKRHDATPSGLSAADEAAVERWVAQAPPLSEKQKNLIAAVFHGALHNGSGGG
jgi:hypothetical protein